MNDSKITASANNKLTQRIRLIQFAVIFCNCIKIIMTVDLCFSFQRVTRRLSVAAGLGMGDAGPLRRASVAQGGMKGNPLKKRRQSRLPVLMDSLVRTSSGMSIHHFIAYKC